ncbi:cbb3-type cytochrome oxidase assembly protein CcoS [Colwelliaceae bacterium BS250]
MSVIYILIPVAILFTAIAIYLFFWAVKSEQFDDLEKQGMSILFEDDESSPNDNSKTNANDENTTNSEADKSNRDTKVNKSE